MTESSVESRQKAKKLLVQARSYKIMAKIFAIAGLIVFAMLYVKNVEGNIMSALHRPAMIFILLIPFLPAIVLSLKASKAEKKLKALVYVEDSDKAASKDKP